LYIAQSCKAEKGNYSVCKESQSRGRSK